MIIWSPFHLIGFAVVICGLCVIRRLPRDIREFRNPSDPMDRIVIALYWIPGAAVGVWICWLLWNLVRWAMRTF